MNFVIGVYSAPFAEGALAAFHFARAVLEQNLIIQQIYFYHNGSLITLSSLSASWQHLAETHNVSLLVCPTAMERRGISSKTVRTPFQLASPGQFVQAIQEADRYIIFGG